MQTATRALSTLLAASVLGPLAAAQLIQGPDWSDTATVAGAEFGRTVSSAGDVNADGYEDVLVVRGEGETLGRAFLYLGGSDGLADDPVWETTLALQKLTTATGAGDVNGDGYDDILVGEPLYDFNDDTNTGQARLYHGTASGVPFGPIWFYRSTFSDNWTGYSVAGVGDLNDDGFDDVAVGAPHWNAPFVHTGAVHVFYGSPTGLPFQPFWTLEGNGSNDQYGISVAGGDVNGDGYDDLFVGADDPFSGQGYVEVYYGASNGIGPTPQATLQEGFTAYLFGETVACAGDVNADGYEDVLVGASDGGTGAGQVYLYLGSDTGLSTTASWVADAPAGGSAFGKALASAGDVNLDGFGDILVGDPKHLGNGTGGRAALYLGSLNGPVGADPGQVPAWTAEGVSQFDFGISVASADVNGDGLPEIVVGAPGGAGDLGYAELYRSAAGVVNWPGSGADFRLTSAVGALSAPDSIDSKQVELGDTVKLHVESPGESLLGKFALTYLEVHATGAWAGPFPGIYAPEMQLNILGAVVSLWLLPGLPSGGDTLQFDLPNDPDFLGLTIRFQSFLIDFTAPNGLFHASDAHAMSFLPL